MNMPKLGIVLHTAKGSQFLEKPMNMGLPAIHYAHSEISQRGRHTAQLGYYFKLNSLLKFRLVAPPTSSTVIPRSLATSSATCFTNAG